MTKTEYVHAVSAKSGVRAAETKDVLNAAFKVIEESLARREPVDIAHFGIFDTRTTKERVIYSPLTGQDVNASAKHVPCFRAGKALKKAVERGVERNRGDE